MKVIKKMYCNDTVYQMMKKELLANIGNHDLKKRMIRRFKVDYACVLKKYADANLGITEDDWQNNIVSMLSNKGVDGERLDFVTCLVDEARINRNSVEIVISRKNKHKAKKKVFNLIRNVGKKELRSLGNIYIESTERNKWKDMRWALIVYNEVWYDYFFYKLPTRLTKDFYNRCCMVYPKFKEFYQICNDNAKITPQGRKLKAASKGGLYYSFSDKIELIWLFIFRRLHME